MQRRKEGTEGGKGEWKEIREWRGQKGERRNDEGKERGNEVAWSSDCRQHPSTERHVFSGLPGQVLREETIRLLAEGSALRTWAWSNCDLKWSPRARLADLKVFQRIMNSHSSVFCSLPLPSTSTFRWWVFWGAVMWTPCFIFNSGQDSKAPWKMEWILSIQYDNSHSPISNVESSCLIGMAIEINFLDD